MHANAVRIQGAISLDDRGIFVAQENILGLDGFLEFRLRRRKIAGNADHFNVHVHELLVVCTELGEMPRSASIEVRLIERQKDSFLAEEVLHPKCTFFRIQSLRQLEIRSFLPDFRRVVRPYGLKLRIAPAKRKRASAQPSQRQQGQDNYGGKKKNPSSHSQLPSASIAE